MSEVQSQGGLVRPQLVDLNPSVDHGVGAEAICQTPGFVVASGLLDGYGGGDTRLSLGRVEVDFCGDDDHDAEVN